jgi:glucose-6-phosphate dehydrogenase assembly protein OpcA
MAHAVTPARAFTATVVAVSTAERIEETSRSLGSLRSRSAVRTILISLGDDPQPAIKSEVDAVSIENLLPRYLNNAVASLRLSSLPSIAWWRGEDTTVLGGLAQLVDRLVLDANDPTEAWAEVPALAEDTAISDLRWTALTRWRNLMAQLFDVTAVQSSAHAFSALTVAAADQHAGRLFAGWMKTQLPAGGALRIHVSEAAGRGGLQSVELTGGGRTLKLELMSNTTCIRTSLTADGGTVVGRIVPLGDQSREALMAAELRVRARDAVFEQAVAASLELH